ncbi:HIT family protein [Oceanirhabdus sp. W0125-5]|uniref:HIT family protein n=1 Tax=Oceanirhabdus sp. W0125-5 TaxID=2999116 RepID=UPI0022F33002|nr:HIT family protein [Oceanirhabdus sp. W0125-5]WBW97043.1 HIT family protein [Oceanirhabdus sp. W0125-5]
MNKSINEQCKICNWVTRKDSSEEAIYFIAELETGYVFLSNKWQYFKGYTIFISKVCEKELHRLPYEFRMRFLFEMTQVSEAVQMAFGAKKINCESLGNSEEHLHWHIIPRYKTDPRPDKSIWSIDRNIIESVILTKEDLKKMQYDLKKSLISVLNKQKLDSNTDVKVV